VKSRILRGRRALKDILDPMLGESARTAPQHPRVSPTVSSTDSHDSMNTALTTQHPLSCESTTLQLDSAGEGLQ
jgi:hypothetical protein